MHSRRQREQPLAADPARNSAAVPRRRPPVETSASSGVTRSVIPSLTRTRRTSRPAERPPPGRFRLALIVVVP